MWQIYIWHDAEDCDPTMHLVSVAVKVRIIIDDTRKKQKYKAVQEVSNLQFFFAIVNWGGIKLINIIFFNSSPLVPHICLGESGQHLV